MLSGSNWGIEDRGHLLCPSSVALGKSQLLASVLTFWQQGVVISSCQNSHEDQMICVRKSFVIVYQCDREVGCCPELYSLFG